MADRPGLGMQEDVDLATLPDEGGILARPTIQPKTPREWVQANLFSSPYNTLLTIVFGALGIFAAYHLIKFVFVSGQWEVFRVNLRSYMTGRFPLEEIWRPWTCLYFVAALGGLSAGVNRASIRWSRRRLVVAGALALVVLLVFVYAVDTAFVWALSAAVAAVFAGARTIGTRLGSALRRPLMIAWLLAFPAVIVILRGFGGVPPRLWGGFLLNIIVAVVAIALSFPIGLLLALGRRSTLPIVRYFCIGVIELVRGNPLYILLTAGAFLLPLLLPPGLSDIPLIIRAMAIFVIFSSAYVAEIVRGGLQGLPEGQYEASRALGLSYTRMMALVVLPQALRSTIPAMISHFISLFKDTSLLAVIGGFTEALRAARRASAGLGQAGNSLEALVPAALLFFVVAFSMSRWSLRLERRLGVGER